LLLLHPAVAAAAFCCVLCILQAFYKSARVEFLPVGVVGAIVPWNWPFHNIINPISAAVMAGNAIVVKVGRGFSASKVYGLVLLMFRIL
jgi:acyl-CoA reductase-like NAD-dependent aldehyde dehydrogenase